MRRRPRARPWRLRLGLRLRLRLRRCSGCKPRFRRGLWLRWRSRRGLRLRRCLGCSVRSADCGAAPCSATGGGGTAVAGGAVAAGAGGGAGAETVARRPATGSSRGTTASPTIWNFDDRYRLPWNSKTSATGGGSGCARMSAANGLPLLPISTRNCKGAPTARSRRTWVTCSDLTSCA